MRVTVLHDLAAAEHEWAALKEAIRAQQASGVIVTGNATTYGPDEHTRLQVLHRMLDWLGSLGLPAYVIPGQADVPERAVLQALANHEITQGRVYLVHGLPAFLDGEYVVAGFGGAITEAEPSADGGLSYPLWRAELALHSLRRLDQLRLVVLHGGPASSKAAIDHLIKEYVPRVACVGGDKPETHWVGDSLVVVPGAASAGCLAMVDLFHHRVELSSTRGK